MPSVKRPKRARRRTYLREWRKYRQMTLEQVAKILNFDHSSLQRLETGQTPYSQDHLEQLAEIYRCQPTDLISRDPNEDPVDMLRQWAQASPAALRRIEEVLARLKTPR